jgi:uroporphyrinogen-III decarboxylase
MNVEERVLTALRCEQPDRVPILMYLNPYVEDWYSHLPTYANVLSATKQYADVVFNWNFAAPLMFTAGERWIEQRDLGNGQVEQILHTPDGPISEIVRLGWRGRQVIKRWIRTVQDAERTLSIPYVPHKPDLETFFATRTRLEGLAVAQATFGEPIALANWIDERSLARWCAKDRGLVRRLLDAALERIADGLRTCLDAGVGPIYALSGGRTNGVALSSAADFEEFVVAYDRRLVELIHGYDGTAVILQDIGKVAPVLDLVGKIGMDGLCVFEPPLGGDCSLTEAKLRIGDRFCLIANLPYEELARGSAAQMERLLDNALAIGAPGGGFALSPCVLPRDGDLSERAAANLVRYLEMAHQRVGYPLQV